MSYLVGDISVLLAFKIQIQGAWVIVSLQKCENKEQKDNYFMGFFLTLLKKLVKFLVKICMYKICVQNIHTQEMCTHRIREYYKQQNWNRH